jgi:hypothetical protein
MREVQLDVMIDDGAFDDMETLLAFGAGWGPGIRGCLCKAVFVFHWYTNVTTSRVSRQAQKYGKARFFREGSQHQTRAIGSTGPAPIKPLT